MAYPVKVQRQGPGWLKGLNKYVEKPPGTKVAKKDNAAAERNHGGDSRDLTEATYTGKGN